MSIKERRNKNLLGQDEKEHSGIQKIPYHFITLSTFLLWNNKSRYYLQDNIASYVKDNLEKNVCEPNISLYELQWGFRWIDYR